MQREIRRGRRGFTFDADPVQGVDGAERVVPHGPKPGSQCESVSSVTTDAVNGEVIPAHDIPGGVAAISEPELPVADVFLIVEDLLWQGRHLADLGAPIETGKAILDHVVAMREGRG